MNRENSLERFIWCSTPRLNSIASVDLPHPLPLPVLRLAHTHTHTHARKRERGGGVESTKDPDNQELTNDYATKHYVNTSIHWTVPLRERAAPVPYGRY